MENADYNRLIYNNKLYELADIWNISDLTRYQYIRKYLLEYLLEKNIHTTRMDNYVKKDSLWINLYLKYKLIEPILKSNLDKLLVEVNNELLLDKLLTVLNDNQKMELYQHFKKDNYWLFVVNESLIIDLYAKHNITLPRLFIKLPTINDSKIEMCRSLKDKLDEFTKTFFELDYNTLNIYITEFKRKALINRERTINDIDKLIKYKKKYPKFKLSIYEIVSDEEYQGGVYVEDDSISINQHHNGVFNHELSHLLYKQFDEKEGIVEEYKRIQRNINNSKTIKKIIDYLNEFHNRYNYMLDVFAKLYLIKVKEQYGNYKNYFNKILEDVKKTELEFINVEKQSTLIYLIDDNIELGVEELIYTHVLEYAHISTYNYYTEELFLENLFDSLLKGRICNGKYKVDCLSGHSMEYYKESFDNSFNECLADFDAIKNSYRADTLINKLRDIVGNELVDFLEEYIDVNRKQKVK